MPAPTSCGGCTEQAACRTRNHLPRRGNTPWGTGGQRPIRGATTQSAAHPGTVGALGSGWVATQLPEGAETSAHHLASWTCTAPRMWIDADMLIGEVADEIERLNGRPTSAQRVHTVLAEYLAAPAAGDVPTASAGRRRAGQCA